MTSRKVGSLFIGTGPMCSGKTTWLLGRLASYAEPSNLKVLYVGHKFDNRSEEVFSTHSLGERGLSPKVDRAKVSKLEEVDVRSYDVIGVDEGQFFGLNEPFIYNDLYSTIRKWVDVLHKIVLIAGLTGNYRREPFGHIVELEPFADEFYKFSAHCVRCLPNHVVLAPFTHRAVTSDREVLVGGTESYIPLCRSCYEEVTGMGQK